MKELKNYSAGSIPLSAQQFKTALSTLARFHASSILTETRLGKPLNKIFPNSFNEKYFNINGEFHNWVIQGTDLAVAMAQKLEIDHPEDIKGKMMKVLDILKPTKFYKNVISHGDLWGGNLMFDNNQPSHCIFVDFQLVRYAPLVLDLIQLIYLNTYESVTEEYKIELLKHYHNSLLEIMAKNHFIDAKMPSFKEVLEAFNYYDYYGKIITVVYIRQTLKAFNILKKDLNMTESFYKADLKHIFHFMDTNEKFKNQMKTLINNILSIE